MNTRNSLPWKLLCSLLLLAFLSSDALAQLKGDTYAEAKQKGSAQLIYTYVETPGFSGKDASGNMTGFCVGLMNAFGAWVKKHEGIELKTSYYGKDASDFKRFMATVQGAQGGVFGLGNITITEERKKSYQFSPPFITNVAILVTHKNVPTLEDKKQIATAFAGMQAVVVRGTTNEDRVNGLKKQLFPALTYQYVGSSPEALKMVADNPKLFANLDFTYYLSAIKDGLPIKRHPAGDESTESFGLIMPKSNDWSPLMERFMNEFVNSTEYRKLITDNLGPNALKLLDSVSARK
ncbi:substrate-binding periplasmic protein [Cesiribacter andamanensis]|uniref:Cystine transporter subunit n=1 Tax=Cesiribacter andamanensis AMV16 TaxID=1279009 RepID=M7N8N8_9BACT|nr:transporter substrate-binding domain-containing protein [Cesiribacter andamanensis]EMR03627.1 cystine transporter subunit [Cesiribacter andamanensis AMV16]